MLDKLKMLARVGFDTGYLVVFTVLSNSCLSEHKDMQLLRKRDRNPDGRNATGHVQVVPRKLAEGDTGIARAIF